MQRFPLRLDWLAHDVSLLCAFSRRKLLHDLTNWVGDRLINILEIKHTKRVTILNDYYFLVILSTFEASVIFLRQLGQYRKLS